MILREFELLMPKIKVDDFCRMDVYSKKEYLEQVEIQFLAEGINRFQSTLIAELKGSYVQQSQRYVKMSKESLYYSGNVIEHFKNEIDLLTDKAFSLYERMTELKGEIKGRPKLSDFKYGIPYEDARYIFPLAITTNIQISLNGFQLYLLLNKLGNEYRQTFNEINIQIMNFLKDKEILIDLFDCMSGSNYVGSKDNLYDSLYGDNIICQSLKTPTDVELLDSTTNMIYSVARGALTSTSAGSAIDMLKGKNDTYSEGVVERVMGYGHTSIAEQSIIKSVSQMSFVTYHQFIRHRLPENVRQNMKNIVLLTNDILIPPSIMNSEFMDEFKELANSFRTLREKIETDVPNSEFAYNLILNCDTIKVVSKSNARIEVEIAKERTCRNAQWEIRNIYEKKVKKLLSLSPILFKNALPSCVYGTCKEGKLSCGKAKEVKEYYLV